MRLLAWAFVALCPIAISIGTLPMARASCPPHTNCAPSPSKPAPAPAKPTPSPAARVQPAPTPQAYSLQQFQQPLKQIAPQFNAANQEIAKEWSAQQQRTAAAAAASQQAVQGHAAQVPTQTLKQTYDNSPAIQCTQAARNAGKCAVGAGEIVGSEGGLTPWAAATTGYSCYNAGAQGVRCVQDMQRY